MVFLVQVEQSYLKKNSGEDKIYPAGAEMIDCFAYALQMASGLRSRRWNML